MPFVPAAAARIYNRNIIHFNIRVLQFTEMQILLQNDGISITEITQTLYPRAVNNDYCAEQFPLRFCYAYFAISDALYIYKP